MTNNNRLTRTIMTWVLASITMLFSQTEVYTTDSHSMPLYENQNQQQASFFRCLPLYDYSKIQRNWKYLHSIKQDGLVEIEND